MRTILSKKFPRILKNKKRLEKVLNIKISNRGKEINIKGNPEEEYVGGKVIDAINFGFPLNHALSIKKDNFELDILNIKDHTKTSNLERVRARLIGKRGRCLKTLSNLTNCYLEIKDNEMGIIGPPEFIENATEAIISIIKGQKQSRAYCFLEKHQPKPILDLGLKKFKKKK